MKKLLSTLLISLLITATLLVMLTFAMRVENSKDKKDFRTLTDNIALNISGQGLSMPFMDSDTDKSELIFCQISNIKKDSCTLRVYVFKDKKSLTVDYPCQIKEKIIYSVGLDYAKESVFCLTEYLFMGGLIFIISFAVISAVKIIKS